MASDGVERREVVWKIKTHIMNTKNGISGRGGNKILRFDDGLLVFGIFFWAPLGFDAFFLIFYTPESAE